MVSTSNFEFLKAHGVWFYNLAAIAERTLSSDPNSTLIKMRQLGEAIAQNIAARVGVEYGNDIKQVDSLRDIDYSLRLHDNVRGAFHTSRKLGNTATHEFDSNSHLDALKSMMVGHALSTWFHSTFGGDKAKGFRVSKFVKPEEPPTYVSEIEELFEQLKIESQCTSERIKIAEKLSQIEQEEALANYRAEVERENKVNFDHFRAQPKEQKAAELQRIEKSHFEMDEAEISEKQYNASKVRLEKLTQSILSKSFHDDLVS